MEARSTKHRRAKLPPLPQVGHEEAHADELSHPERCPAELLSALLRCDRRVKEMPREIASLFVRQREPSQLVVLVANHEDDRPVGQRSDTSAAPLVQAHLPEPLKDGSARSPRQARDAGLRVELDHGRPLKLARVSSLSAHTRFARDCT